MNPESATGRYRSQTRLLFDENLPWRVAAALSILEFNSTYVGDEEKGVPSRGSSDEDVLDFAQKTNQVIVTINYDMVLLCAERQRPVIWIDPKGRGYSREDLVLLVFKNVNDWEHRLNRSDSAVCIRALRTKTETLDLSEAARQTRKRMRRIAASRHRKQQQSLDRKSVV